MTNDFSVEQKKPVWPYTLVGAGAGAALGTQLPKWTSKPMSHEQIVEEVNDKDKFEKRIAEDAEHATEWKDVQAQAAKVKKAEEELANASKPSLPSTSTEARELAEAKEKLQKEIDRLQAIENSKVGTASVSGEFDPNKLPAYDKLHADDLPRTYAEDYKENWKTKHKAGDQIETTKMKQYYEDLKKDVTDRYNDLARKLDNTGAYNAETGVGSRGRQKEVIADLEKAVNDAVGKGMTDPKDINDYFRGDTWTGGKLNPSEARLKAMNIVTKRTKDPSILTLTKDDIISISEAFDKCPSYDNRFEGVDKLKIEENGRKVDKWYKYDLKQSAQLLDQRKKELVEKQKSMTDEIVSLLEDSYNKKLNLNNFDVDYEKSVSLSDAKATGLYDEASSKLDLAQISKKGSDAKAFDDDIKLLEEIVKKETSADAGNETFLKEYVEKKATFPYTQADAEKALEHANARKEMLKDYLTRKNEVEQIYKDSLRGTELVTQYDPLIEKVISGETEYAKALESFKKAFPTVGDEAATVSSSARTITESDVAETFRNAVRDKQKIYDDAVAKNGGKVDEALKATKEKLVADEKSKLSKMTEELSGKVAKVPGMKKGVGYAIGVVALGLAGWGIGKAVTKNKEA